MVAIASYSSEEFNIASIESPQFGSASEYCFQFYYNFHVSRSISTYTVGYSNLQKKVLLKLLEKCNNYFLSICANYYYNFFNFSLMVESDNYQ